MSIQFLAPAMRRDFGGATAKLVFLAFADHAGHDGLMWPSVETIAAMVPCSPRTVQRCVEGWRRSGLFVEVEPCRVGRGQCGRGTVYRIDASVLAAMPGAGVQRPAADVGTPAVAGCVASGPAADPADLPQKGVTSEAERGDAGVTPFAKGVTSETERGDIAVSPKPLGTGNTNARARDPYVLGTPIPVAEFRPLSPQMLAEATERGFTQDEAQTMASAFVQRYTVGKRAWERASDWSVIWCEKLDRERAWRPQRRRRDQGGYSSPQLAEQANDLDIVAAALNARGLR